MSKRSVFLLLLSIVASLILAGAPALAAISAYAAIGINDGVAVVGGVTRSDNPGEDQAVYPVLGVQILSYVTPASSGGAQSQVTAQLPQYYQAYTSTTGSSCVEEEWYKVWTYHFAGEAEAWLYVQYFPWDCEDDLITNPSQ